MSARTARRIAAGATALALAGLGLAGLGATAASAADTISSSSTYGGTFYLANADTAADYVEGTDAIPYLQGIAALPAAGDWTNPVAADPTALGATGVTMFIAPQGQEADRTKWNAYADSQVASAGQYLQNPSPSGLVVAGPGTPSGIAAVAAAGGDYSLGWAYTKDSSLHVVDGGLFYVHIHVTAGTTSTATYTYERVLQQASTTPTTTSITANPTSVGAGDTFSLTASVSPAAATGSVEFFNGSTSLGTASVAGGTATLATASIATAGAASITAHYSGDTTYGASVSAPVTVTVNSQPVNTTTTVSATSADNKANHPVTLSATVAPTGAVGTVAFTGSVDGGSVTTLASNVAVNSSGVASISVTGLGAGAWSISAAFTGTSPFVSSASTTPATLTLGASTPVATPDPQDVTVTIPDGTLTITTPFTAANPLDLGTATLDDATSTWQTPVTNFGSATDQSKAIQIVDRRSGAPGFTAQVSSTAFQSGPQSFSAAHLGLVNLATHQVTGNPLLAGDVTVTNIPSNTPGLSASAQTFATYPAGKSDGTAWISGDLDLHGVESSVQPGTYRATLTFTAF